MQTIGRKVLTVAVQFVAALSGSIVGLIVLFYSVALFDELCNYVLQFDDMELYFPYLFAALFIGMPAGASLGILFASNFLPGPHRFRIVCATGAFVLSALAGWFVVPLFIDLFAITGSNGFGIWLFVVATSSLIGYDLLAILTGRAKRVPRVKEEQ